MRRGRRPLGRELGGCLWWCVREQLTLCRTELSEGEQTGAVEVGEGLEVGQNASGG